MFGPARLCQLFSEPVSSFKGFRYILIALRRMLSLVLLLVPVSGLVMAEGFLITIVSTMQELVQQKI